MEKKQFELCHEILRRFHKNGILKNILLIGSWCLPFYKDYFSPSSVINEASLKTRDIDFLIPKPSKITKKVDISNLVQDLGFVTTFSGGKGYMKLNHPDLLLEFLVPERGRGTDKPFPLPKLGMNASTIRYLTFISENIISVKFEDFNVQMPHPANFALHKIIVSQKRTKKEKADKDHRMAIDLLEELIKKGEENVVKRVFESVPSKWQKLIMNGFDEKINEKILSVLR